MQGIARHLTETERIPSRPWRASDRCAFHVHLKPRVETATRCGLLTSLTGVFPEHMNRKKGGTQQIPCCAVSLSVARDSCDESPVRVYSRSNKGKPVARRGRKA